jgi:hypothetical protein
MTLKTITANNIKTRRTSLNQLVDVIQEDVSGSATRRTYQVFVTGGVGPGVTSSLYQTVYDQDFTLQTSNQLFDMTVGIAESSSTITNSKTGKVNGKYTFDSGSLMMREKMDIYRQHAAHLLGNANSTFVSPFGSEVASDVINHGLFLNLKRLFTRDGIRHNTFAIKLFRSGAGSNQGEDATLSLSGQANLFKTSLSGSTIFSDTPSNQTDFTGAKVGNIVNAGNANENVGLVFYDKGSVVLDMDKVFSGSQHMSGTIPAMSSGETVNGVTINPGFHVLGSHAGNVTAKFIPDFLVSGSIDTIVDHIAETRFSSGSLTAMTFQNRTDINSTLIFCQATADEFNYSSNPTYTDTSGNIVVIDSGQEDVQRSFTFPTTVGLHDNYGNLLAVAKFSRPIEKNDEKDITFRIRLDF